SKVSRLLCEITHEPCPSGPDCSRQHNRSNAVDLSARPCGKPTPDSTISSVPGATIRKNLRVPMPRIQQLPPTVITKIAAGEVIQRPASVVKELLESAGAAGSSRIDVEIEQGGVDRIRVVDNGCGILADGLPLAFASHATSKLANADDLFRIGTLGFRGE